MKKISLTAAAALLSFFAWFGAPIVGAQNRSPVEFRGLLNDYSPSTVSGGPWEMHGQWTLSMDPWSGKADFSADMTMSGYGKTADNLPDPTQPGQKPHTHHIRMTGDVTWNSTGCPSYSPATFGGFQVNGPVSLLTGNGSNATFETSPPTSVLQVCITGGENSDSIPFSNITMFWANNSPAISHFGPQAIHGVVRDWNQQWATLWRFSTRTEERR